MRRACGRAAYAPTNKTRPAKVKAIKRRKRTVVVRKPRKRQKPRPPAGLLRNSVLSVSSVVKPLRFSSSNYCGIYYRNVYTKKRRNVRLKLAAALLELAAFLFL